jgi:hypothetical protein
MADGESVRQILIISGGQTGVDRAALDVALELGLPVAGWCPRGRRAEDGPIAGHYPLVETPSSRWSQRTDWNVRDSDATLVLSPESPTRGTALTIRRAVAHGKPHLVLDPEAPDAVAHARRWLETIGPKRLNVAGPRESSRPGIHRIARTILHEILSSGRASEAAPR